MMTSVRWIAILIVLLHAGAALADWGPLQLKNRFPLHLLFLTPRPVPARTPDAGDLQALVSCDYSAVYFNHANQDWSFLIDKFLLFLEEIDYA